MTAIPLLTLEHIGVNYGLSRFGQRKYENRWVLRNINFTLHKGESLGVIGRNGIGKSTLLKVMAGIMSPDEGAVRLQPGCRAALLSLHAGFIEDLPGKQNVYLSGLLHGMTIEAIKAKFNEIVAFAELEDAIHRPVKDYSDGMKARLGFAISMQINPDILLVDEVLGVGDAIFRKKSADTLKARIQSEQTAVLVSHNPDTIKELCSHALWIENGGIQAYGSAEEVIARYKAGIT
jgi:lipopolysaccharide transport system ATP-binding protein